MKRFLSILILSSFYSSFAQEINLNWVNSIGNGDGGEDVPTDMQIDDNGNYFTCGYFFGTIDLDPSIEIEKVTSYGGSDGYVAKYNEQGNLIWSFSIGGPDDDKINSIDLDSQGNVYVTGFFEDSADFDPSDGTQNLHVLGYEDIFMAKYSPDGELIWTKDLGGVDHEYSSNIRIDENDLVYVAGSFRSTVDFDPSPSTANMTSNGDWDAFFACYDSDGDYMWSNSFGDVSYEYINDLRIGINGSIYLTGAFQQTVDFDPGIGTSNLSAISGSDIYIAKYENNGDFVWAFNVGGSGYDQGDGLHLDAQDNIYATGTYLQTVDFDPSAGIDEITSNGGQDAFLAKYDSTGSYILSVGIGGSSTDNGHQISTDDLDNMYVTGKYEGTMSFDSLGYTVNLTSNGGEDAFLLKYNSSGNFLWGYGFGSNQSDNGNELVINQDNDVCLAGHFDNTVDFNPFFSGGEMTSQQDISMFLAVYNQSGAFLNSWSSEDQWGGLDRIEDVEYDALGNLYVTGRFHGYVDFDSSEDGYYILESLTGNENQIFVAKYDPSGVLIWAFNIGDASTNMGYDIELDGTGNFYLTGCFQGIPDFDPSQAGNALLTSGLGGLNTNAFFAKYDTSGNYLWAKALIGNSNYSHSMDFDANNNIVIVGYFNNIVDFDPSPAIANMTSNGGYDAFVAKYDSDGNYLWSKQIGGAQFDNAWDVDTDDNANIYIAGVFRDSANFDSLNTSAYLIGYIAQTDAYIVKYNSSGNFQWAHGFGDSQADVGWGVHASNSGDVFFTGGYQGTVDFDPSVGTDIVTSNGSYDMFLSKYDSLGTYLWNYSFGEGYTEGGYDLTEDDSSNLYITGFFGNTVDFDPSPSVAELTSNGQDDIFTLKLDSVGNYVSAFSMGGYKSDHSYSVAVSDDYEITIGGGFYAQADFDPDPNSEYYLHSDGGEDMFLGAFGQCFTSLDTSLVATSYSLQANLNNALYQWVDCSNNYQPIIGANDQLFEPDTVGTYAVILYYQGCKDTSHCYNLSTAEINSQSDILQWNIYPNPTKGTVNIKFSKNVGNHQLEVIDIQGNIIISEYHSGKKDASFELQQSRGIYIIRVTDSDGNSSVKKLVLNR